ncbi:MAG: chromate transporter [Coprobacillus sp.]|nr:chromate transporter [Coprobacillus sp.]MDY4145417.1 chromate transporter [Bacilli bacterium]CCY07006.1 chromate transport protein [Coprobacillus sp. CAG:698]
MENESKSKKLWVLFLSMLKIGLFTFGGGYAMISLMQREFVEKKKWITQEEFMEMIIISESTPGPLSINGATYIGYSQAKFLGALLSTIAVCIPSFIIIFIISLYLDRFMSYKAVECAFRGIEVCVCYLILSAGIKMFKENPKDIINIFIFLIVMALVVLLGIFNVSFSSILYILICAIIGLFSYLIRKRGNKNDLS